MLSLPKKKIKKAHWGQLYGGSLSFVLSQYAKQEDLLCVITPHLLSSQQLFDELTFFFQADPLQPEVFIFPDWETLPYDQLSPHQDIISDRLLLLNQLPQMKRGVIIIAISTLMHLLCPTSFLDQSVFQVREGQLFDFESFRTRLITAGYHQVEQVMERGEYAVRGEIVDIFPMGSDVPYRIQRFDNRIEQLRSFDPNTQKTLNKLNEVRILPAREFILNEQSIQSFRQAFRTHFPGNPTHSALYADVTAGRYPHGIEYYLPFFFDSTSTFFDYLPKNITLSFIDDVKEQAEIFFSEIKNRYQSYAHDIHRPLLPPEQWALSPERLFQRLNDYDSLHLHSTPTNKKNAYLFSIEPPPDYKVLTQLQQHSRRIIFVVETAGRREIFLERLKKNNIYPSLHPSFSHALASNDPVTLVIGALYQGAECPELNLSIIVESQLMGQIRIPQQRTGQKTIATDLLFRDLTELNIGAPVVHLNFGVGRYAGLMTLEVDGLAHEFLTLTYAHQDKLYVPVTSLHLIHRYAGKDAEHAPLHKLGNDQWEKEKKQAKEKIHDVAVELLKLYAIREATPGFKHHYPAEEYQRFTDAFPFEETVDQQQAIRDIIQDMQTAKPMDRLICGDVGFGKTEVAMRAAFIAVQSGKQVCVLVPTTLLATQHFETFRDRFANFPVEIELLSRFKSKKESEKIIQKLSEGKVDIIIGTHKLFQKNIQFSQLGLLIIDEEHRFGVKQKEHLKTLKTHIDLLSMTATPIPRTLNMAMHGIRDISLITTPPAKRLSVKTFWKERNNTLIKEAIFREILRGGQVFFLHNEVNTIAQITQSLSELIPEARIAYAHGQMRERELERIMSDFYHHRFNVLVCTTIIETGIDIPTANTIIIDAAHEFGLAQLHQLRGRVGRSHHQAYAYLLTPNEKLLSADAKKRLTAITSFEHLGSGFLLATQDLEIRGAGELLGEEQSGNMLSIGFELFMSMLEQTIQAIKQGQDLSSSTIEEETTIEFHRSSIIPETYLPDPHLRLMLYKKIADAKSKADLQEIQIECIDRFGLLPDALKILFEISSLKQIASLLKIKHIRTDEEGAFIEFFEHTPIDPHHLILIIQKQTAYYQWNGPNRIRMKWKNSKECIDELRLFLLQLTPKPLEASIKHVS